MTHIYQIKNMVCPRCIEAVAAVFNELHIEMVTMKLGEVTTSKKIDEGQKKKLNEKLTLRGFELLEDPNSKLINQIKSIIVEHIHHNQEPTNMNFSSLLTDRLNHEYSSLSRLFSSMEGITIEKFILKQKMERVKELIIYNELTFSEIAFKMGYSSVAHLSNQFKKETGMSPTTFKQLKHQQRNALDSL